MEKTALPDGHGGYLLNRLPLCDFVDGIRGQLNKLLVQPAWPSDLDFFFIMASVQRRCPFDLAAKLAIDFLAMSNAQDQNHQAIVFDLADKPVITHAIFPELSKS
jgi:hypothetical protein